MKPFFTPIPTFPIKGEGVSQRSPRVRCCMGGSRTAHTHGRLLTCAGMTLVRTQVANLRYRIVRTQAANPRYRIVRTQVANLRYRTVRTQVANPRYRIVRTQAANLRYRIVRTQVANLRYRIETAPLTRSAFLTKPGCTGCSHSDERPLVPNSNFPGRRTAGCGGQAPALQSQYNFSQESQHSLAPFSRFHPLTPALSRRERE